MQFRFTFHFGSYSGNMVSMQLKFIHLGQHINRAMIFLLHAGVRGKWESDLLQGRWSKFANPKISRVVTALDSKVKSKNAPSEDHTPSNHARRVEYFMFRVALLAHFHPHAHFPRLLAKSGVGNWTTTYAT
jgi:hypothetical protein